MEFLPNQYYRPDTPEMAQVAARQTLAIWRSKGVGPKYVKSGSRVLYKGSDVLDWLEAQSVETAA